VHQKLLCLIHFLISLAIGVAGVMSANAQDGAAPAPATPAAAARASQGALHGHITDPSGALIPGANVTITNAAGTQPVTVSADAAGAYEVHGLAPGGYIVSVTFDGFAPAQSPTIQLAAGQSKRVDIAMAIQAEQQSIVVTDETPAVNIEAGGNSNAIVLKGKDLDALSDDPDELSNELSALAGPSAGPNGGQIYIDGFSGGQLPPKSAIREIRINQNPFSAEYDRLGYGRIEILTKPGTDKLHGQVFVQGNDKSFNTGNPFTSSIPDYYSYQFNGTVSGAINKSTSFFLSGERRNIENVNAWLIPDAVLESGSGVFEDIPNYGVNLLNRRIRDNASVRFDVQLGARNTLTARYGFWSESEHGDLNGGSLPSASTHESNTDHTVQISDSFILNDHTVNETRAQFERQNENHFPDSTASTILAKGDFTGGGYPGQEYRDHGTRLEFWNITTISHGAHAIKFGARMRDSRDANLTDGNFNKSFSFGPVTQGVTTYTPGQVYARMANGLASGETFNSLVAEGFGPIAASFTTGKVSTVANVFDVALFAQDDWKVNQRLTLSGGLRWESQNHISDHNDWAPRVSMAYALDGKNGKPAKTVLRAGYGYFYDRFGATNLISVYRSGIQNQVVLNFPSCDGSTARSLDTIDLSACKSTGTTSGGESVPVRYQVAPHFHSPYTGQAGVGLERQLNKGTSLTLTYLHSFGPHQLVTRNANQFDPSFDGGAGGFPLNPDGGYIYQFYPEAVFKQNQLIANVNARVRKNLSLLGFYTFQRANSDGGGGSNVSNAYDLSQDYGPATFASHNMLFAMANYTGPWALRFNPFLIAQSGRPFNVVLPVDTLNNFGNQRPTFATSSTPADDVYATPFGNLDIAALPGEKLLPANVGTGPASVAVNLRVSRAWGFGPELSSSSGPNPGGGPPDGGGPGGRRGGPPGGGLGPGGLGGGGGGGGGMGGMFGPQGSGRKYTVTFSAQALNLFNNINYGGPNGTLGTPRFDRSTTLAGGIFSTGSAARRIFVQAVFSF